MAWKNLISTRSLFRPLPWWIVVSGSFFILLKLHLSYVGTPCAILGMSERLDTAVIKKKFRQISMCTHPDRLRGRLKRTPTNAEVLRGQVLFNRASVSKDELQEMLARATKKKTKKKKIDGKWVTEILDPDKPDPVIYCHERSPAELEMRKTARDIFRESKAYFVSTGLSANLEAVADHIWRVVSFQGGIMGTVISVVWISFFYKLIKSFCLWIWGIGAGAPFYLVQVGALAPIPTIFRFFYLPLLRVLVYVDENWKMGSGPRPTPFDTPEVSSHSGTEADEADVPKNRSTPSTAQVSVGEDKSLLRRRKRIKPSEEANRRVAREEQCVQHLQQIRDHDQEDECTDVQYDTLQMGSWEIVSRSLRGKEQWSRAVGAKNIQVELLVILTKPILPLLMVISLGQVWSGFVMSMIMWEAYRRIPTLFYEYHHIICMVFGFIHTWVGLSANEVERQAEADTMLRLQWEWGFRDCVLILFLCIVGSENAVFSFLGNEPAYTSSFASGLALRIMFEGDFIRNLSIFKWAQDWLTSTLAGYGMQLATKDEQLLYGGGGIGDCGGGTVEMFVGDGWSAVVAGTVQLGLCMLPLLYAVMWLQRGIKGFYSAKGSNNMYTRRFPRICARMVLGIGGILQVALCLMVTLNTSHGGLYNFWLSMLLGIWFESIISTYDIRGPIRSLVFLLIICLV